MLIASSTVPVVAAAVTATVTFLVAIATLWINGVRHDRARRRDLYAGALEATQAYREFAYAVPRRRCEPEHRSEERVRITEALRAVQRDLARHQALLDVDRSAKVAAEYRQLVAVTRRVAGTLISRAWEADPITTDREVNVGAPLDFSEIEEQERHFLSAIAEDLRWYRDLPFAPLL